MAWSYEETDLSIDTESGRLNSVRLLIGDTDIDDQQIQDEEVLFSLALNGSNIYLAGAWCARTLAAKFSRLVNTSLDGALSADYSDMASQFFSLAERLEYQGKKTAGQLGVKAGGISKVAIDGTRANTDRVQPSFRRDRFRNPPGYSGDDYGYDYD